MDRTRGMRRMATLMALGTAGLGLAACGGSNRSQGYSGSNADSTYYGPSAPQNASAGPPPTPVPVSGNLVADNGFRPSMNGFSIQNYGNDGLFMNGVPDPSQPVQNMTPAEVNALFGDQVCYQGTGDTCQLIPPAQQWMDQVNQAMAGGHCMGFSVTALRIFSGNLKPADLGGASDAFGLQPSPALERLIAQDWAYQVLPSVTAAGVSGDPNHVLDVLIDSLKSKDEYYTVTIFKRDGSGGHAVTPFAVVDHGGGQFGILLYDNNFPNDIREIKVDRHADTWKYTGGANPSDLSELYEGDAQTQSLGLLPTKPGERLQPCPFCNGQDINHSDPHAGSVLGAAQRYNDIVLTGDPANHAHLVLTDSQGRQTGLVNGREVNDIPGVTIDSTVADRDWSDAPNPTFHVPVSLALTVTIDGSNLKAPDKEELSLTGPGDDNAVQDIKVNPGQKDTVAYTGDGTGFAYATDPQQAESPILVSGVQGKEADFAFAVKALNVAGGSKVALRLDQAREQLDVDTAGTAGAGDYVISVDREDQQGSTTWLTDTPIHLAAGEVVHVDYGTGTTTGSPLELQIRMPDGQTRTEQVPLQK